jgi:hypothetical protein
MLSANAMERRLQFAGILLVLGLLVEALCLTFGRGAMGFLIFVGVEGSRFFSAFPITCWR